jgi:steroid delta-isomerase-like uncharacterized protein
MSIEDNKDTVCRYYDEVFNKDNLAMVGDIFASDFVLHGQSSGMPSGHEGLKQIAVNFRAAFPDLHVTVDDMVAENDKVAVRLSATGKHQGVFMGVAPTGKRVTITGITIYRFADSKIAEAWPERSDLGTLRQLGVILK